MTVEFQQRVPNLIFLSAGSVDFSDSWVCWTVQKKLTVNRVNRIELCSELRQCHADAGCKCIGSLLMQNFESCQRCAGANVCLTTEARTLERQLGRIVAPPVLNSIV